MTTNPVTQKQLDFINTLKSQNSDTKFLSGIVSTYNRINNRQGRLPIAVSEDIIIGDFSINDRIVIPANGSLTPSDVIEMKNNFDSYIASYVPETTADASAVIDILKNGLQIEATVKFAFNWLKQNYTVTSEFQTEGYCKGMTKHFISK